MQAVGKNFIQSLKHKIIYNLKINKTMKTKKLNFDAIMDSVMGLITQQREKVDTYHEQMSKKAEKLGMQDGSLNLPRVEDPQASPNEGMIKYEYQKFLAELWKKGKPYLDGPHLEYQAKVQKLEDFEAEKKEILADEKALLDKKKLEDDEFINSDFDIKKAEIENYDKVVQRDYLMAKSELETVQERTGRMTPIIQFKSTILYVLLLMGIGICEVPLNMQIFQKFGEAFFITVIMAASLAIAIPVLAHFTGVFVKQRKEKREFLWLSVLCIALFVIFNFGVSIFRAYVLADNIGEESSYLNIIIFTTLNLILFIIGVLAAYNRHDESYELEHAHDKFVKEKKKYDKEKLTIQDKLKALKEQQNTELKARNEQHMVDHQRVKDIKDSLIAERNNAAKIYDELLNAFIALEEMVDAGYRIAIERYRAANLMHRNNHISPESWMNGIDPLKLKFAEKMELDPN